MPFALIAASLIAMQAGPQVAEEAQTDDDRPQPEIEVVETKPEKITDRRHPDYIRCKSEAIIGSRAKRKRTCMTNGEWELVTRRNNELSREFVNQNRDGFMDGQGGLGGGTNTGLGGLGGG